MTQKASPLAMPASKPSIHRSDTSSGILPQRFPIRLDRTPNPELPAHYPDDQDSISSTHCVLRNSKNATRRGRQFVKDISRSPSREHSQGRATDSSPRSPARPPRQVYATDSFPLSSGYSRNLTHSPTKTLEEVSERDEFNRSPLDLSLGSLPSRPKKRSRSPMKKMFGEHGWLGLSPDEVKEQKLESKKSSIACNEESSSQQKKTTMFGKLKNKLGEIVSIA